MPWYAAICDAAPRATGVCDAGQMGSALMGSSHNGEQATGAAGEASTNKAIGKGQMRSALMGSRFYCFFFIFIFFDRGTLWVLPLTYFYFCLPKSARAYIFPQYVNIHYFCSGPISVAPICPQPSDADVTHW